VLSIAVATAEDKQISHPVRVSRKERGRLVRVKICNVRGKRADEGVRAPITAILERTLRAALDGQRLSLHYQQQCDD
jgi:hypothetical protein